MLRALDAELCKLEEIKITKAVRETLAASDNDMIASFKTSPSQVVTP